MLYYRVQSNLKTAPLKRERWCVVAKTDIKVKLVGEDGNAFAVMGAVSKALRRGGRGDLVDEYRKEAMSGDYDNLLRVSMNYVEVE